MSLTTIVRKEEMFAKATGSVETIGCRSATVGLGSVDEVGGYYCNNGVLAFVDADRTRWVGRHTSDAIRALQDAGYVERGLYVPHSNDSGIGIRNLLAALAVQHAKPSDCLMPETRIRRYIEGSHLYFRKATGTEETIGGIQTTVGTGSPSEVGGYYCNNGVLAFVDADRIRWVGRHTSDAIRALQDAGYTERGVYVPHSNDSGVAMRRMFDMRAF